MSGEFDLATWWPLILLGIGAAIAIGWYVENRRRAAFEQLAADRGCRFDPGDSWWSVHFDGFGSYERPDSVFDAVLPAFSDKGLFEKGHRKARSNVVDGEAQEIGFKLFDYRYTAFGRSNVGADKGLARRKSKVRTHTVVILRTDSLSVPPFQLRPESLGHKLASATVGFQDIDFSAFPMFSKEYLLRGPDEDAIRAAFDSRVLNWFSRNPGLAVEGHASELVVYRPDGRVPVGEIERFLRRGLEIASLFARGESPRAAQK